jgi:hypothetical protein
MTPEVIARLEEAFAWGCSDIQACLWADIDDRTLYKYQEKNPEFIRRKEALKENPVMLARKTILKGLKANPDLALKFLERKVKNEFSLRNELTGADGKDLPTPILGSASITNTTTDVAKVNG